jgi:drug/metabolite transporter (DMT)-like permease
LGGYYPPPDYLGGWGPAQPVPRPGTNGLAIASLVTALIGFFCCIGSIVAIVLGTIALDRIKRTREEGFGLAVAGIVLGVTGLVVALIFWIFAMRLH